MGSRFLSKKSRLANLLPLLNNCSNCFPKNLICIFTTTTAEKIRLFKSTSKKSSGFYSQAHYPNGLVHTDFIAVILVWGCECSEMAMRVSKGQSWCSGSSPEQQLQPKRSLLACQGGGFPPLWGAAWSKLWLKGDLTGSNWAPLFFWLF